MPRTLIISMSIVIICYLLCNVTYILVLGGTKIAASSTVALVSLVHCLEKSVNICYTDTLVIIKV